jgi:homopolymeric O-antigen transport system permease protein
METPTINSAAKVPSRKKKDKDANHSSQTPPSEDVLYGQPLRIIEPSQGWSGINWLEMWQYRDLFYFLTWRDIKIRYKQTVFGSAWAILQPFLTMLVFTLLFGNLAGLGDKTDGIPYPIYVMAGLLPWTFFSTAIANSANSLVGNTNLITKIYFPRLVIPLATVGAALMDLAVASSILVAMMAYYRTSMSWQILLTPVFVLGLVLVSAGVGAMLSGLTVAYRDFKYVVPFLVQIWMFLTPVIYPTSIIPPKWRWLMSFNPIAGLIDGFRAAFLSRPLDWPGIGSSLLLAVLIFLGGAAYFRSVERRFADII